MGVSANGARALTMYRCAMTGLLFHSSLCSASPLLLRYPETRLVIVCSASLSNVRTLDEHIRELPHYCEFVNIPTLILCVVSCPASTYQIRSLFLAVRYPSVPAIAIPLWWPSTMWASRLTFCACPTTVDGSRTHRTASI